MTTQINSITYTYSSPLTKKDIIHRLFIEEKISFDEMWILLQNDDNKYIPMPYPMYPSNPFNPLDYGITCTSETDKIL